jgi:outer membrane protein TolC
VDSKLRTTGANLAAMERAVQLEVNAAWEERDRARSTVELTRRSVQAAAAAYDQQVVLYRAGEATTTDVIGSEAERMSATLQDVNARIDVHVAQAKLERASGRMLPIGAGDGGDQQYVPRRMRTGSTNG